MQVSPALLKNFGGIILTDQQFLDKLKRDGVITWVEQYPWSGYKIVDTCLVLRQARDGYVKDDGHYTFDWYISTWAFTIVVKTIKQEKLFEEWPTNMLELDKKGLELNEQWRDTADF